MLSASLNAPGQLLLLVLDTLPRMQSLRSLTQIMDRPQALVANALNFLEKDGCIRRCSHNDHFERVPGTPLAKAVRHAYAFFAENVEAPPLAKSLLQLRKNNVLDGCEETLESVRTFLHRGHAAAALTCLDIMIDALGRWPQHKRNEDESRRYLSLLVRVQGISMYLAKSSDKALELLYRARKGAQALGDQRLLLLLDLMEASQGHLAQHHNSEHPRALLARTLEGMRALGDSDIQESAANFIALLHFMQGEQAKALECFSRGRAAFFTQCFHYMEEMRLRYMSAAAASLGRLDVAAGIAIGALREAQLSGQTTAARWLQVQLGDMLLRLGRLEEGLALLDTALLCCDSLAETKLWLWIMRLLAFYHFQKGRIAAAYTLLHQAMSECVRLGFSRPYYGFTWILDILLTFQEHNFPPLPGYALDAEVNAALKSPNALLHAGALRVRAKQQMALGAPPQAVIDQLRRGLIWAEKAGSPQEMARCRLALAQSLYNTGNREEADALYDSAYETLAQLGQFHCPPPRDEEKRCKAWHVPPPAQRCQEHWESLTANLPEWNSLEQHLQQLLECLCESLAVERAALACTEGASSADMLASCRISRLEWERGAFLPLLRSQRGCEDMKRLHTSQGAVLLLPLPGLYGLPDAKKSPYTLLLLCRYVPRHIDAQDKELFARIARSFAQKLETALVVERGAIVARRTLEERARLASTRLDGVDSPYYGVSLLPLLQQADQVAATDAPVLILGETGVGKEMLARRIHAQSGRVGAFVPVHPAAVTEALFESEFFGHEKGAFTGAHKQKIGLFEVADKGTLFIDEVGDIPPSMQTKLLRVLQEKHFLRVGGTRELYSDFRLVTATNRDLQAMVRQGTFREDIYYRVAVVPLHLPPLHKRPEDVLWLAQLFLERFAGRYQHRIAPLRMEEKELLCAYAWPGNIRELKSVMERVVILRDDTPARFAFLNGHQVLPKATPHEEYPPAEYLCEDWPSLEEMQRRYIRQVLEHTGGKVDGDQGAANILGLNRSTLYARMHKYGLSAKEQLYGRKK